MNLTEHFQIFKKTCFKKILEKIHLDRKNKQNNQLVNISPFLKSFPNSTTLYSPFATR